MHDDDHASRSGASRADAELGLVRPLVRTRQYRDFTPEPPSRAQLDALLDVARWTGSSRNTQPWRFILVRDPDVIGQIADAGMTLTRSLQTAPSAIVIVTPRDRELAVSLAYDEGRVAERILIAASMLGLGAGIAWLRSEVRPLAADLLALPDDWFVRTVMAVGHPTVAARAPKSAPGTARRPREEIVFENHWGSPASQRPVG